MGRSMRRGVLEALEEAEGKDSCCIPSDESMYRSLLRASQQGLCVNPHPGLFIRADRWESLEPSRRHACLVRGIHEVHPDWVFYGPSAAQILGLEVAFDQLDKVHVAYGRCPRRAHDVVVWHALRHRPAEPDPTVIAHGVPVTNFERTVCDCLCMMDFSRGMAVADSALRMTRRDGAWLEALVKERTRGLRGARQARMTAAFADARPDNGGESCARATMHELGFRDPELQVGFVDQVTGERKRVDFLWRLEGGRKVIGEFDGIWKYYDREAMGGRSAAQVLSDERIRESRLTRAAPLVRIRWNDLYHRERLAELLESFAIPREREPVSLDVRPSRKPRADKGGFHERSL